VIRLKIPAIRIPVGREHDINICEVFDIRDARLLSFEYKPAAPFLDTFNFYPSWSL
jgi:hypothetical protein